MNVFLKAYCRVYQWFFRTIKPLLPYRNPKILESIYDVKNIIKMNYFKKPLIVTGKKIKALKLTDELEKDLINNNITPIFFDNTNQNPDIENIEEGLKIYLDNECDCIIAFGGGSPMDCAKLIGARVTNPKKQIKRMRGLLKVKNKLPLLIAIPTTAGTGSEVTLTAVFTDKQKNQKYTVNDFNLIPNYAILDANLTTSLSKEITATTGMDALTHAIEAYIGNSATEETKKASLNACKLIFQNIEKVYIDGSNIRSRQKMLEASYLAGIAFSRSYVGYVHAIAHSLGGKYDIQHGLANAVILPYMLNEYGNTIYSKIRDLAVFCDIARKYDTDETATSKFIDKIFELNTNLNIPKSFDFINEDDIEELSKKASKEANPLYPVPKLMNAKELTKIYYKIKS